jgi:hypothetical protein
MLMTQSLRITALLGALGAGAACVPAQQPGPAGPPSLPPVQPGEPTTPPAKGQMCGGIAAMGCPQGQACADDPNDGCDPGKGGRDCSGVCTAQPVPSTPSIPACALTDPSKRYVGKSPDECSKIRFACDAGTGYFSDACGCGCQQGGAEPPKQ